MEANTLSLPNIKRRVNDFFQEKLVNITRPISDPMHMFSDDEMVEAVRYWIMCYSMGILTQKAVDTFDKIMIHKIGVSTTVIDELTFRYSCNKSKRFPITDPLTKLEEEMVINWHRYFFAHPAKKNETPFN